MTHAPGERAAREQTAADSLPARIRAQAYGLGFDLVGIASLAPADTHAAYEEWIGEGRHGTMQYLARGSDKRRDTRLPYSGAVSAIVVAMDYGGREPAGPVARYARGDDYHDVMVGRLDTLHAWLSDEVGHEVRGKSYVDTGPILERDLARRAGLGWFGKNTNLINPRLGSFFFIGALLVDVPLEPDAPFEGDLCGTCTRCIEACPTDAITAPRELDANRCISYLTIELRDAIPLAFREPIGENLYGCDICQDVCPWNVKFSQVLDEPSFAARASLAGKDARTVARGLLAMTQEEFAADFRASPMKRAKLRGLKRNAAVVLGNIGAEGDVPALVAALDDPEPLARQHAAWALGRIGGPLSVATLRERARLETDPAVATELATAVSLLEG